MEKKIESVARILGQEFINFVNKAVSPFHVVHEASAMLREANFKELSETDNWTLEKGGKYYFTRNQSTIIAFQVGNNFNGNNTGFKIVGAHTDSPYLRLAPISKCQSQDFQQTCVSLYGGGLWHTWFDRDLTLGGRIIFNNKQTNSYDSKLFYYPKPLLKVPNLAIHLTPADDRSKFAPNTETHIKPIFANEVYQQLCGIKYEEQKKGIQKDNHYAGLMELIQKQTGINPEDIVDLDFYISDVQPAQFFGLNDEFISSARIDNLVSSFIALKSIMNPESFDKNSSYINMISLFDNEECGSESFQGAGSNILFQSLDRIYKLLTAGQQDLKLDSIHKTFNNSFFISADMAHGVHPNYSDKHKQNHVVKMNKGVVLKVNHNQRYATDAVSASILRILGDKFSIPLQDFIVKNDSPCGSTIGPIIASKAGIKTVDIGLPQLSMHSIRETCGVIDLYYYEKLMTQFFAEFDKIPQNLMKY